MKAIISHDVDHITVWEHKDLIVPKFLVKSTIEAFSRTISPKDYLLRYKEIARNKWQNIEELIEFNKKNSIPSTFFLGVNHGVGLVYSLQNAKKWAQKIISLGYDAGVHGIAYDDLQMMQKEHDTFKEISNLENFGIRMHYLRNDPNTITNLSKCGYLFDSTVYEIKNPYKVGDMWEFPLHIMDGYEIFQGKPWQYLKIEKIKDLTKQKIENIEKEGIEYLSILFHDRYFNESVSTWMEWYFFVIDYLKTNNIELISYREAIKELEDETSDNHRG